MSDLTDRLHKFCKVRRGMLGNDDTILALNMGGKDGAILLQSDIDAAADRIEELEAGWLPIESAPKDGSWFLAIEDANIYKASYHADGYIMSACGQPVVCTPEPTHWQPLPPSPEESQ